MNSQIGQSTSNTNRRKLIISCVFNQIHYLDCPLYVLITENGEIELVPIDQNPIFIGQFYKYMSFFFKCIYLFDSKKLYYLHVSLSYVQSSVCRGNPSSSRGLEVWVLLFTHDSASSEKSIFFPSHGVWSICTQEDLCVQTLQRYVWISSWHSCYHIHKRMEPFVVC